MRMKTSTPLLPQLVASNVVVNEETKQIDDESRKKTYNITTNIEIKKGKNIVNDLEKAENNLTEGMKNLSINSESEKVNDEVHKDNDKGKNDINKDDKADNDDDDDDDKDDNDDEIDPDMVAKCPTRTKDKIKQNLKEEINPYSIQHSFYKHGTHNGGQVIVDTNIDFFSNILASDINYIPQTVIEHENSSEIVNNEEIDNFIKELTEEEVQKVVEAVNICDTNVNLNTLSTQQKTTDYLFEHCNSPEDSSYGTLSPASVPSPNYITLHSPSPSMSTPKYYTNTFGESDTSCSSSSSFQLNDYDLNIGNEMIYNFNQESKWNIPISPLPYQNNVINITLPATTTTINTTRSNSVLNEPLVKSPSFKEPEAPIQSYLLNKQKQSIQIPQPRIIRTSSNIDIKQPTGKPTRSVILSQSNELKYYTKILPPQKFDNNRILPNIRPSGIPVNEIELDSSSLERFQNMCNKEFPITWGRVCLESETESKSVNELNQTKLMQLLQEKPSRQFIERVFSRVCLIKKYEHKELLATRDNNGHNALYMAAILHKDIPVIARFIADISVELKLNPDEVYGENKNSILHILAGAGDAYAHVLADLLHATKKNGTKVFDINRKNKNSQTPLHVAANSHLIHSSTLTITHLLVKHEAKLNLQDDNKNTALHLAVKGSCDPEYIKKLLQSPLAKNCVNIVDTEENTPLHLCIAKENVTLQTKKDVVTQLITSGASHNIHKRIWKLALAVMNPERRQEIKQISNRKYSL